MKEPRGAVEEKGERDRLREAQVRWWYVVIAGILSGDALAVLMQERCRMRA